MEEQTNGKQRSTKRVQPLIEAVLLSLGYDQKDAREAHSDHEQLQATEHNSDRTKSLALFWFLFGVVIVSIPYAVKSTDSLFINLCSVLGTLFISSAGIATLNSMYLRRTQMKETQAVISEKLNEFQNKIEEAFINKIDWAKAIEVSGVRNITNQINTEKIKDKIKSARKEDIKFLFISYATIHLYWEEFREALSHGCTITFLVGDPDTNTIINFYE